MIKLKTNVFTLLAFLSLHFSIYGQENLALVSADDLTKMSLNELLNIKVYSASKNEESLLSASGTVYTVSKEEIELYGWTNLREILSVIPNMDLGYNYDYTYFGQRGFHGVGMQTLILVNGNTTNRLLNFEALLKDWFMANEIERIEVYMGPNSTLYGTSAIFGVINIVTKNFNNRDSSFTQMKFSAGSGGRYQQELSFNKAQKKSSFGASFGYLNNKNNFDRLKKFAGSDDELSRNQYTDPVRNHNAADVILNDETFSADFYANIHGLQLGYRIQKQITTQGLSRVRYQWGENQGDLDRHILFLGYDKKFNKVNFTSKVSYRVDNFHWLYTSRTNIDSVDINEIPWARPDYPLASGFEDLVVYKLGNYQEEMREYYVEAIVDFQPSKWANLMAGINAQVVEHGSAADFNNRVYVRPSSILHDGGYKTYGVFGQGQFKLIENKLSTTVGIRWTNNQYRDSLMRNVVSPRISINYQPSKSASLTLTYNEGYRIDFYQGLETEQMHMIELNYRHLLLDNQKAQLMATVTPYWMRLQAPLMTIINPNPNEPARVIYSNGPDNTVMGIEGQLKYNARGHSCIIGGRLIKPDKTLVNREQQDEDYVVKNVPVVKFKLGYGYKFKFMTASLFVDYWSNVDTETFRADHQMMEKFLGGSTPQLVEMTETYTTPALLQVNVKLQTKEFEFEALRLKAWVLGENLLNRDNYHVNTELVPVKYLQHPINVRFGLDFNF